MSWSEAHDAECPDGRPCSGVETVIVPRPKDIGDFEVRRALPAASRRSVGPFVFFDQMGPATLQPGHGMDVRPHPHIGLATLTWLVEGEIMHRDSLGYAQPIRPGEVNWMTAGRGIVHSERSPEDSRDTARDMNGLQVWLALPRAHEETAPAFEHYTADRLPRFDGPGMQAVLVAGDAFGERSPVRVLSETLYMDVRLQAGAAFAVPEQPAERAVYVFDGDIEMDGARFEAGRMVVFEPRARVRARAVTDAHFFVLGGEPLDAPRHLWWNFVSSSRERLEQAKADWRDGRFPRVPGEEEFIPLPER